MPQFLLLVVCALAAAQPRPVPEAAANLPAQKIGADDLIAVGVYGSPELTRTVRVGSDGLIRLPMLKRRLRAEGRMPAELETDIAAALGSEQILVEPVVSVTVVEYHSRPISVAGAVRKPLTFQAYGTVTLLDALTRADGLSAEAGPEILVSRSQPGADGAPLTLVQRIPVRGLIDGADPELNLRLHGGEEIRVPDAGRVFVVGNVRRPGAYTVRELADMTVLKILALAEGLAPFAAKRAFVYRREAAGSSKNEIPIELGRIVERKSADVPLQPDDILYIPDNKGRRMTATALDRITGFAGATASGVLIWRR